MSYIRIDLPNTNNKLVEFELENVNMFIIHVVFRLTNIDTIRTRPMDTNGHPYLNIYRIVKETGRIRSVTLI